MKPSDKKPIEPSEELQDLYKEMIQQSLWNTYKTTGNEAYKILYEKWYENYEGIEIKGLDR